MQSVVDDTIISISGEFFFEAVSQMARLPEVKREVERNHDNNRWWPNNVSDWRLRMVFAGWSTRVSYAMIGHYANVVNAATAIGYDALVSLPPTELRALIAPIGLANARREYLQSLDHTLQTLKEESVDPLTADPDELIELFAKRVSGASYKVAQCAVLYARGYHCGIMPIDSGMCEMLGPAMPFSVPRYPGDHEAIRKHLERLVNRDTAKYLHLIQSLFYKVSIPRHSPPTWCVHLILIYYKRLVWNKHKSSLFPRGEDAKLIATAQMLSKAEVTSLKERFPLIIVEGADGAGKSTIVQELSHFGYRCHHSPYNPDHESIMDHYTTLITASKAPIALDRSFFSEMVYGPIFRSGSRISDEEVIHLCMLLAKRGAIVLYLNENLTTLIERNLHRDHDAHNASQLRKIASAYEVTMRDVAKRLPVYWLRPSGVSLSNLWRALARSN